MTRQYSRFLSSPMMPASVLILTLLATVVIYAFLHPDIDGRIFFYPDNAGTQIGSERRGIPHRHGMAAGITVFLDELILGPETLAFTYTLPRKTTVRQVAIIAKTAYIDLSMNAMDTDHTLPISFNQILNNLRQNIFFNFSGIEKIVFMIEGQQVYSPSRRDDDGAD